MDKLINVSYIVTFFFSHSSLHIHLWYTLLLLFICCHVAVQENIAVDELETAVNLVYAKW